MWDDLARRASRAVAVAVSIGGDDGGLLADAGSAGPGLRAASASAASASRTLRTRSHSSRSNLLQPGAAASSSLSGGGGGGGGAAGAALSSSEKAAAAAAAATAAAGNQHQPDDPSAASASALTNTLLVDRALAKTTRHLMPVVLLIVGLNYLDRTALSFAGVSLSAELSLSASDFGFASGAFFLGYSLFQLPSNLVVMRIGARRWLPVLMVAWGAAASAFAAIKTPAELVFLRFVLGAAEAGAFPCIWYALSLFYPRDRLTRPYATMLVAVAVSQVVAAPLAAAMLSLDGRLFGLRGWQVVFLAEGVPAVALGLALPWLLPDGPGDAPFLSPAEREALRVAVDRAAAAGEALMTAPSGELAKELGVGGGGGGGGGGEEDDDDGGGLPTRAPPASASSFLGGGGAAAGARSAGSLHQHQQQQQPGVMHLIRATASRPEVWVLALSNILKDMAAFAALFFCPLIVASLLGNGSKAPGATTTTAAPSAAAAAASSSPPTAPSPPISAHPTSSSAPTGALPVLLTAVPFGCAAAATYWWSGRAQERGDPAWHAAVPFLSGGALFALYPLASAVLRSPVLAMASLTAGLVGAFCGGPLIVVLVTAAAPPQATAVALPLFNSVGMVGGFMGPVLLGWIVDHTGGSYGAGAAAMGVALCGAGGVLWALRAWKLRRRTGGGGGSAVEFAPLSSKQGGFGSSSGGAGGG